MAERSRRNEITMTVIPTYQVIYTRNGESIRETIGGRDMMEASEEEERYEGCRRKLFERSFKSVPGRLRDKIDDFIEAANLTGEFDTNAFQRLVDEYRPNK